MPKTRFISPGIANHSLKKNLELNNHYISNDGGDEGITVQDDGDVIVNGSAKLYLNDAGGEYLSSNGSLLTIASGAAVRMEATIQMKEQASANLAVASYGQIWVKDTSPSSLYFTTDAGSDIELTRGTVSAPADSVALDDLAVGDAVVNIGTTSGDIVFKSNNSSGTEEWLTFNTDDMLDSGETPVTEILGKSNQRLRIRSVGTEQDIQINSGRNVVLNPSAITGATGVSLWRDRTPTAAEYNLSAAWQINQSTPSLITQVADQSSPAAQFRGSTGGTGAEVYYETDGSGIPTFSAVPDNGGKSYTGKITINGVSFDHDDGSTADQAIITHNSVTGLAVYQSITGTGIPTGAYIGSITDSTHFVIHREGAVVSTTSTQASHTVYARDRVAFQDGGSTSNYVVLEVARLGNGMVQFGTRGASAVGQVLPSGYIDVGVDNVGSNMHLVAKERLVLRSDDAEGNCVVQLDADSVFLSGADHTGITEQSYTAVHGGDRFFVGNSACNRSRIRIDGTDANRVFQIAATELTNSNAFDLDATNWGDAGGLIMTVAKTNGNTTIDTSGNLTLDAEGGTLTLKNTATASADTINITSVEDIAIAAVTGIEIDSQTGTIKFIDSSDSGEIHFLNTGSGDCTMKNLTSNKDVIFNVNDGGSDTEVMRLDGSESSLLMAASKKISLGAAEEYIYGDGTDIHIGVGSGGDINIPASIGMTFGDDGEKIEGDGTDLTISSSRHMTLDAEGDIVLDANGGNVTLKDGGSTYTPSYASDATTKAYVDANAYHFIRVGFVSTSTSIMYMPMPGAEDLREGSAIIGLSEIFVFLAPFDGSLETIWARSESVPGSTVVGFFKGTGTTETPPTLSYTQSVTVDMSADDTSYEFDFAGAGTNTFSQGNILSFSVNPTSALNDAHFMIVLKFDVST